MPPKRKTASQIRERKNATQRQRRARAKTEDPNLTSTRRTPSLNTDATPSSSTIPSRPQTRSSPREHSDAAASSHLPGTNPLPTQPRSALNQFRNPSPRATTTDVPASSLFLPSYSATRSSPKDADNASNLRRPRGDSPLPAKRQTLLKPFANTSERASASRLQVLAVGDTTLDSPSNSRNGGAPTADDSEKARRAQEQEQAAQDDFVDGFLNSRPRGAPPDNNSEDEDPDGDGDDDEDDEHDLVPTPAANIHHRRRAPSPLPQRSAPSTSRRYTFAGDEQPMPRPRSSPVAPPLGAQRLFGAFAPRERDTPLRHGVDQPARLNNDSIDDDDSARFSTRVMNEKLQRSARFNLCKCNGHLGARTPAQMESGRDIQDLTALWEDVFDLPDILRVVTEEGLGRLPTFPPNEIKATNWKGLLAGIELADAEPTSFNLSSSQCSDQAFDRLEIERTWDIDAVFLPLKSLAAHRLGLQMSFYPKFLKTIASDWHTTITHQKIIPRECKHLRLGRGIGTSEFDTYIFFPNLPLTPVSSKHEKHRRQCYVTQREQSVWIDSIFLPAMKEVYGDDVFAHIARSFEEAKDRAYARQTHSSATGQRQAGEHLYDMSNSQVERDNLVGELPNRSAVDERETQLGKLWEAVLNRIPPGSVYEKPELVAVTYNTKLLWRRPLLSRLQAQVGNDLRQRFDTNHVDFHSAFVDLAYEDVPKTDSSGETYVALRRSTCNIFDLQELGLENSAQAFQWFGTMDASSVRAAPGKTSPLRGGGLAYMQSYNLIKDLLVSPDRATEPLFSDESLPFLAYTPKTFADLKRLARDTRAYQQERIDTVRSGFKGTIMDLHRTLKSNSTNGHNIGVRQEYRITWDLFMRLRMPDHGPMSAPSSPVPDGAEDSLPHRPYFVIPKLDLFRFMRMQLNRWLFAICAVISIPSSVPSGGRPATSLHEQGLYVSTCSALFSCIRVIANSECVAETSRIGRATYTRPPEPVSASNVNVAELWRQTRPGRREGGRDDGDNASPGPSQPDTSGARVFRRGLRASDALRQTNMIWLPEDMFAWDRLCFKEDILADTAFASPRYRSLYQSKLSTNQEERVRRVVAQALAGLPTGLATGRLSDIDRDTAKQLNKASRTLWNMCIFGFSFDLLKRLTRSRKSVDYTKLPEFWSGAVSEDERRGFHGLSYGLIHRMTGSLPVVSHSRSGGGKSFPGGLGFADFPNTWEARLEILFDHTNKFRRTNWETVLWRRWFEYCYDQFIVAAGELYAEKWRLGFPTYAAGKLTVLPRFEADKLYQVEKLAPNISEDLKDQRRMRRGLKWQAAVPVFRPPVPGRPRKPKIWYWQMLIQDKGTRTPNELPRLVDMRSKVIEGQRLKYIDDLIGAEDPESDTEDGGQ